MPFASSVFLNYNSDPNIRHHTQNLSNLPLVQQKKLHYTVVLNISRIFNRFVFICFTNKIVTLTIEVSLPNIQKAF